VVNFDKDVSPARSALTLSVLNEAGAVLAADVASGTNLNTLPAVDVPAIRLRCNLSTTSTIATRLLLS